VPILAIEITNCRAHAAGFARYNAALLWRMFLRSTCSSRQAVAVSFCSQKEQPDEYPSFK
jgi:hypothetical protein